MTTKLPSSYVGKQLYVGSSFPDPKGPTAIGGGPAAISGSAYIAGPAIVGNSLSFLGPEATLMVSRCLNPHALALVPSIFKVTSRFMPPTPIDVVLGDMEGPVGIMIHSLSFTQLNDTFMTITTPILNINANEIHIGTKAETGAEVKASARAEVGAGAESDCGITMQSRALHYMAIAMWLEDIRVAHRFHPVHHHSFAITMHDADCVIGFIAFARDDLIKTAIVEKFRPRFDLVIIDVFMPKKDRLQVIREIIDEFPDARFIAMSGAGSYGDSLLEARRLGAQYTFRKPFNTEDLLQVIQREVGRP